LICRAVLKILTSKGDFVFMPSTPAKPRVVLFLVCALLYWFTLYTYIPTMTPYLSGLGFSSTMIGLIGGSYGFSQMFLRIPLGIASDRIGKRKLFIIFGLAAGALSSLGMFFTENAFLILLLRLTSGVSASAWVSFTVMYSGYFSKDKMASSISYLFVINAVSLVLAKLAGGFVADHFGHEYTFLLGGAVGLIAVILSLFTTESAPVVDQLPTIKSLFSVVKNKNLLAMSILSIFAHMVLFATVNTFTPEAADRVGATPIQLGILSTIASVPMIFASLICARLFSKRANARLIIAIGFIITIIGVVIIPLVGGMSAIYVSAVAVGLGCGLCMSALLSCCTATVDDCRRSAAMGFYQSFYALGMFLGPILIGIIVDQSTLELGFYTSAVFALVGFILTYLLLGKEISQEAVD